MAASFLPTGIPPAEGPSPTPSDTSLSSQPDRTERVTGSRSRPHRSPSRANLRTGFRGFSDFATILVGEPNSKTRPEAKYLIHKDLIASASPFFAAALNGTFAEGMDQTVRLPEEKPEIFEWFLQWLYTGTLKTPVPNCGHLSIADTGLTATDPLSRRRLHHGLTDYDVRTDGDLRNSSGSPKYFLLIDLYALSDRLLTTQLSNHILSTVARLSESTNSVPTPSDTWILYDGGGIRDTSPLRTLILDLFAYKKTDKLLETHKDEWHPRFLRELCVKLKRPGPEAIERHTLVAWRPSDWSTTRPCEMCRELVQPAASGDRCVACEKVFCAQCLRHLESLRLHSRESRDTKVGFAVGLTDTGGCKPWNGTGMCLRYHEHEENGRDRGPTSCTWRRSVEAAESEAVFAHALYRG